MRLRASSLLSLALTLERLVIETRNIDGPVVVSVDDVAYPVGDLPAHIVEEALTLLLDLEVILIILYVVSMSGLLLRRCRVILILEVQGHVLKLFRSGRLVILILVLFDLNVIYI